MFLQNEESGKFYFSAPKAIIETHIAARHYQHYYERIIEKTTIRLNHTMETFSKLTVTSMNSKFP